MRWVQSHFASLPADIKEKKLTSAAWASMPRVHREQTSKQEKLTSSMAFEPSRHSRHRREEVDIRTQKKGIRSIEVVVGVVVDIVLLCPTLPYDAVLSQEDDVDVYLVVDEMFYFCSDIDACSICTLMLLRTMISLMQMMP